MNLCFFSKFFLTLYVFMIFFPFEAVTQNIIKTVSSNSCNEKHNLLDINSYLVQTTAINTNCKKLHEILCHCKSLLTVNKFTYIKYTCRLSNILGLTFVLSCVVSVTTFSCADSSSRRSLRIFMRKKKEKKKIKDEK